MRRVKAVAALVVLLGLLLGVPALLAGTIGNPAAVLPDLRAGDITDAALVGLLASVAWLAWAQFALATVVELASALRRSPVPRRLPGVLAGQQQLARSLVTAAFLIGPVAASATLTPHAFAALPSPSAPVSISATTASAQSSTSSPTGSAAPHVTLTATGPSSQTPAQATSGYTIPGDGTGPATLWDLAEAQLGGGERWREIWALNEGRTQPGGARMTSPRRLLPGWTVLVPADAPTGGVGARTPQAGDARGDTAPAATPGTDGEVTVHSGDTLSGLAASHGSDWQRAWQVNAGRAEPGGRYTDPNLIRPGWRLDIPAAADSAAAEPATAPLTGGATSPASPDLPGHAPAAPPAPAVPAPHAAPPASPPAAAGDNRALPSPERGPGRPAVPAGPGAVPSGVPSAAAAAADHHAARPAAPPGDQPVLTHVPVQLLAFAGGGVLLAASTLEALRRLRRRRFRDRTLGRTISSTPVELAPIEKALLSRGATGAADVTWLVREMTSLAQAVAAQPGGTLPDVVAVRLGRDTLELVLTGPCPQAPAPWRVVDANGLHWTVGREDDLPVDDAAARYQSAPYPTLTTVGHTADGADFWLVDLERVGALSLTGDPQRCLDLARFLAAELAHNSWSDQLLVALVGFGDELAGLNPSRVVHRPSVADAVRDARATLRETSEVLASAGTDVLEGRLRQDVVGDGWSPHVLLVAPVPNPDPQGMQELLDATRAQRARTAVAVVLAADEAHQASTRWQLHVDAAGRLTIPALDLQLLAEQCPVWEARDMAALLQMAADSPDVALPRAQGDQPWDAFADVAGAPLPEFTDAGPDGGGVPAAATQGRRGSAGTCVLPLAPECYPPVTATTARDVATLAPPVSAEVRRQVEDADTELDEHLRLWHDPDSGVAKLTLLGPVRISDAAGAPTKDRRDRVTEVVAYLACRPQGVTTQQWAAQMWPDERDVGARPRAYANSARQWLVKDPRTGGDYLPRANEGAGKVGVYKLRGVLVDAELFRRLRLRGVARGADGIADLQAALDLVTGEPVSRLRADGGRWLVDTPVHHHYTAMIVDVAHLVATHHLAAGEPGRAESAAHVSLLAGSHDDIALLDMVAAKDAAGHHAEAEQYVARILANHDAEVEEDLPPRTYDVLRRRRWLPQHDARAS